MGVCRGGTKQIIQVIFFLKYLHEVSSRIYKGVYFQRSENHHLSWQVLVLQYNQSEPEELTFMELLFLL